MTAFDLRRWRDATDDQREAAAQIVEHGRIVDPALHDRIQNAAEQRIALSFGTRETCDACGAVPSTAFWVGAKEPRIRFAWLCLACAEELRAKLAAKLPTKQL